MRQIRIGRRCIPRFSRKLFWSYKHISCPRQKSVEELKADGFKALLATLVAMEFAGMGFPFDPGGAAFGTGASGVVGLVLAVVKFGDEITADGVALRALSDAAGDADLVPVNSILRLDRFNGFAVGGFGLAQDHTAPGAFRIGEYSNALDESDAPLAMNTFNNCTACHDYAEWTAKPWSRNCLAKLFSASSAAAFVEPTGLSIRYKIGLSPPFM